MSVLKWLGLVAAVAGLGAAALMGFGPSSYEFNNDGATSCGSVFFPKNSNDALCNDVRGDYAAMFGVSVVVAIVGLAVFLVARRLSIRSAGIQSQHAGFSR